MEQILQAYKIKNFQEEITPHFCCDCSVCLKQAHGKIQEKSKKNKFKIDFINLGTRKRYTWLLSELSKHSSTSEVIISSPDIVVFNKLRPQYLIQPTKDSIKYINSGDKLGLTEILKTYTKVVRNRKKEERPGIKSIETYGKEIALMRYTANNKDNENLDDFPELEEGPLRVLTEKEFFDFMYERAGSTIWRNIVYIQTTIKCRSGIGNIITVTYNTAEPKDLKGLKKSLNSSSDHSLMYSDPPGYCDLICKRIDALLHYNSSLELLNIKAEFSQDDLGKIWFTYASDIYVRPVNMPKRSSNEAGKFTQEELAALNAELDERIAKSLGRLKFEEYSEKMMKVYSKIKKKTDIDRVLKAKPISYANPELIAKLRTKKTWNSRPTESAEKQKAKTEASFDPRNSIRAQQRFELFKTYAKHDTSLPKTFSEKRRWVYTPISASPDMFK